MSARNAQTALIIGYVSALHKRQGEKKMKKEEIKTLKAGDRLFVSYKGIRPCVFKNVKGNCAYVAFDSGDGKGSRLHRVLATTLLRSAKKPEPKKAPKAVEKLPSISDEMLLRLLADRLG